jgi:hypothetical protein
MTFLFKTILAASLTLGFARKLAQPHELRMEDFKVERRVWNRTPTSYILRFSRDGTVRSVENGIAGRVKTSETLGKWRLNPAGRIYFTIRTENGTVEQYTAEVRHVKYEIDHELANKLPFYSLILFV